VDAGAADFGVADSSRLIIAPISARLSRNCFR
jgi:hypothetical protein